MRLRRLNSSGIELTRQFLKAVKESNNVDEVVLNGQTFTRLQLITNPSYSSEVSALSDIDLDETKRFETTYDFCEYFDSLIHNHNPQSYRDDVGFWTWLAMVYLPQLVKQSSSKGIVVGDITRYIFKPNDFQVYYRHLLSGPFYIFEHYSIIGISHVCKTLLWHDINSYGDIYEQIASRQSLVQNPVFIEVLNRLYFDEELKKVKKGAGGPKAATARRLVVAIDQLQRTRDFFELSDVEEFLRILPKEFDKFNPLR